MTSLSRFEEFARLARHDGIDVKPTLLRVLTDFYIQKPSHSDDEEQHFVALALRLIDEVDDATREHVGRKLAGYNAAPMVVLAKLGVIATTAPPTHSPTPAPSPSPAPAPRISDEDRTAAARFSDMFFAAASEERRAILRELDVAASAAPLTIPLHEAATAIERLEAAALRGRPFEFVLEIERVLAVPRATAEAIIKDTSGEPMLVMAKALGMPIDVVQRLLLLVNPLIGSSVKRVFDLSALYEELSAEAALRLVTLWRHAGSQPVAQHQPAQWPQQVSDPRDTGRSSATGQPDAMDPKHQRAG